jgi:hypothetical protein
LWAVFYLTKCLFDEVEVWTNYPGFDNTPMACCGAG